uniref:Uncharacterized protein n=1 Tax=Ditylenchus dipsaci TaxID=166011 RepID=A0A915CPT0_9BILA
MQHLFPLNQLTFHILFLCYISLLNASFCGKSGVPYSFEVLPSGAPVLGCAQPSCVLSPSTPDEPGSVVEDSEFLTDVNGQADGFFRDGDRASKHFRHPSAPRLIANCSGGFNELSCPRKNQWVGGIEYIDHPRQPLILQCCTFDGEAITGGEVIRNGRQISFDVIANVRKIVKSGTSSKVNYEVTVRRMNCLPDPPEPEVQFDQDVPAEVFKVLSSASNKDLGTAEKLEKKTAVVKQEKRIKVKQQAARTEQLPEISDSTNQVQQAPQLPPPQQQPYQRQLPSPTPLANANYNQNYEASIGPIGGNSQQPQQPISQQAIPGQQPFNPSAIYPQQQQQFPFPPQQLPSQPVTFGQPQPGGLGSAPSSVTPQPTAFHTFAPLAIHTFPTHTFLPYLPTLSQPIPSHHTHSQPIHSIPSLLLLTSRCNSSTCFFLLVDLQVVLDQLNQVDLAQPLQAVLAQYNLVLDLALLDQCDSSGGTGSLTPLASSGTSGAGGAIAPASQPNQQTQQQLSQPLQPQPAPAGAPQVGAATPAPLMMMVSRNGHSARSPERTELPPYNSAWSRSYWLLQQRC